LRIAFAKASAAEGVLLWLLKSHRHLLYDLKEGRQLRIAFAKASVAEGVLPKFVGCRKGGQKRVLEKARK